MILIIMRHGEAVEYSEPDRARALTDFGISQSERVGKWLTRKLPTWCVHKDDRLQKSENESVQKQVLHIDLALISPYLRTQQTFRALAAHVEVKSEKTLDTLTPISNAEQCADIIHGFASGQNPPETLLDSDSYAISEFIV